MRAWNYSDSMYALLNDTLSQMDKSGWTKAVRADEFTFSKDDITDDKDDVPLSKLGTN